MGTPGTNAPLYGKIAPSMAESGEDEDYFVPLEDQRVFGAGIKRKRIAFVPASSTESSLPATSGSGSGSKQSIADRYLHIVLSKAATTPSTPEGTVPDSDPSPSLCTVCHRPLSPTHETTIAHQLCLEHSHPPSHLDRSRPGLRYLNAYGWDPDSRVGLGARSEGVRFPLKPVPKHDTVGLREREDEDAAVRVKPKKVALNTSVMRQGKVLRLDAKEVRKRDDEARKRADKLRKSFYGSEEV